MKQEIRMATSFPLSVSETVKFPAAARRASSLQRTSQALSITGLEIVIAAAAWLTLKVSGGWALLALILGLAVAGILFGRALRKRFPLLASPSIRTAACLVFFFICAMAAVLVFTGLILPWILCEAGLLIGLAAGLSDLFASRRSGPSERDGMRIGNLGGLLLAAIILLVYTHISLPDWLVISPDQLASAAALAFAGLIFLAAAVSAWLGQAQEQ
jgi:hypothetical protein